MNQTEKRQQYLIDKIKPIMENPDMPLNLAAFIAREFEEIVLNGYEVEQCTGQPFGEYLNNAEFILNSLLVQIKTLIAIEGDV